MAPATLKTSIICVSTVCGRISPACMGSPLDRQRLEALRDATGASLIGAATLRRDDPVMAAGGGRLPANRIRAVITGSGRISPDGKALFSGRGPLPVVFSSAVAAPKLQRLLTTTAEVVAVAGTPAGELDLKEILAWLADRDVDRLLIEGGGRLNYSALAQGVVDEIHLTLAPRLLGAGSGISLLEGPAPLGDPFLDLELTGCEQVATGELFLTYTVAKE